VRLSVSKRNQPFQEIDLGKDVLAQDYSETIFLIGRSKDCHIVLDDKKISREHARIIHKNGKWFIEKTNPDNVCQINGENFNRHELEKDDVFTAEGFSVTVLTDGPQVSEDSQIIKVDEVKTALAAATSPAVAVPVTKSASKSNATSTDLNIPTPAVEAENEVANDFDDNATKKINL